MTAPPPRFLTSLVSAVDNMGYSLTMRFSDGTESVEHFHYDDVARFNERLNLWRSIIENREAVPL